MRPNLYLPALMLAFAAMPAVAHAQYLTPEDVLLRDQNALYVPTNPRAAARAAEEQRTRSATQQRPTVVDWWDRPSTTEEDEPAPAHSGPPIEPAPATETPALEEGELDPVTLRWLRRLQQQESGLHEGPASTGGNTVPPSFHSGADLSDTGPASTATILVLLGAVGWTVHRSRQRKLLLF